MQLPIQPFLKSLLTFLLVIGNLSLNSHASPLNGLPHSAGLWVEQHPEFNQQAEQPQVPASTLKLLTAYYALQRLGPSYQFKTPLWLDADGILWLQGKGDPGLTSEVLQKLAKALRSKGLKKIKGVGIDGSYFASNQVPDGIGNSHNPYDAHPGAAIANYNTVALKRDGGSIISPEWQTPMTKAAYQQAPRLPGLEGRINLGPDSRTQQLHLAELLAIFLRLEGISVGNSLKTGTLPASAKPYLTFINPQPLSQLLEGMLKYSNNLIANQLFLVLGAEQLGAPATLTKAQLAIQSFIVSEFDWRNVQIAEAAGLSRQNQLSPAQLGQLLDKMRPYQNLLNLERPGVQAKTGTLSDTSTLAGYLEVKGQWLAFALMLPQANAQQLRFELAERLRNALNK
ncbi:D-alanyl-D-alanine carboxypeptidase/D-alanyl-D-alanine-endopeptidase [Balneatrix alpica]|uniref:D-alanyl-D-alanine carboxypeptidase/D-alanyl-D-alanine-endopeptidase n=1 Tax=Balneatrix alpica TaxID=75684 RepID=A0ABV5Z6Q0_9GAMM|nr:D-alanyl-D-alanine carboxypeptidase [Balneatrix alpica]